MPVKRIRQRSPPERISRLRRPSLEDLAAQKRGASPKTTSGSGPRPPHTDAPKSSKRKRKAAKGRQREEIVDHIKTTVQAQDNHLFASSSKKTAAMGPQHGTKTATRPISGKGPAGRGKSKITKKFVINASQPASDKIFDVSAFEKFLHDKIKVDGRVGNLGDVVQISQAGDGKIEVVTHIEFSGRYLKYLTKKYLKKQQLRDWLRVVSTSKGVYELRFFNVTNDDADDDED